MIGQGLHQLSADEYHNDPAPEPSLSSSIARLLLRASPRHAFLAHPKLGAAPSEHKTAFDIGTAAHALLLEGVDAIEIIDAPDWRTKAAREARDAARDAGRVPLLVDQAERVVEMVTAARDQLGDDAWQPEPEKTIVWQEDGTWCRARTDRLDGDMLIEYKTTRVLAPAAEQLIWRIGYDIQIAFYLRGISAVTGRDLDHRLIVQETEPPYGLVTWRFSNEALALAASEVERAIDLWRDCLATDSWPMYEPGVREIGPSPYIDRGLDFSGLELETEE